MEQQTNGQLEPKPALQTLTVIPSDQHNGSIFINNDSFNHAQRVAKMLSASALIPKEFQNDIPNTMIALEMANRTGASPLMVMQNLYIVHGRPSWSSSFIIAAINASKKFSPLRFEVSGQGDDYGCVVWATELATGERLEGSRITIKMAKDEGWFGRSGSKWKTMPDQMLRYRAATFFGRLYAPEILMGMQTQEESYEITPVQPVASPAQNANKKEVGFATDEKTGELPESKDIPYPPAPTQQPEPPKTPEPVNNQPQTAGAPF